MTLEEKFNRRQETILMLDRIGWQLGQFNRGAAEYAFRAVERLREVNGRVAGVLARIEAERLHD